MSDFDKLLDRLYYKEKNYDSIKELYRKAKQQDNNITLDDVKQWLQKQATYQLTTKPKIGKKEYKKIYDEDHFSFQMDLTFLPKYKLTNKNNYVLFTAININSRYAYVNFGTNKNTETVIKMLDQFLKDAVMINTITMDSGSEFINAKAVKWFEDNDITTHYVVGDSHKLGIINRFHRTLKEKLLKHFLATDSTNWIDNIDQIVENYNNTVNRGIGFTPMEASKNIIQSFIISRALEHNEKIGDNEIVINVGDTCRVKNKKKLFDKMNTEYSDDTYIVTKVYANKVDVQNEKVKIEGVKKGDIVLVNAVEHNTNTETKKKVEKINNDNRKLKKLDVDNTNIVETKRIRKPKIITD